MDAMPGARSLVGVNMDRLKNLRQKALREHGLNPGDQKSSIWKFETIIDKHEEQELAIVGEEGRKRAREAGYEDGPPDKSSQWVNTPRRKSPS